jgi:hypothetical protein
MSDPPSDWLATLSAAVAECLIPASEPAPLAAHVQTSRDEGEPVREVSLFYGATEIVGGARCGARCEPPFWIDLLGLAEAFDRIDSFSWQSAGLGPDDDLGPHVAVEGVYAGRPVRVRVLAVSPRQLPAARTLAACGAVRADRW